ncbi:MAG: O-antigen ligase family protein [Chitinophagales bacterium]|nr:O-antigen ligase family protein [Chitinophagales bacterium]
MPFGRYSVGGFDTDYRVYDLAILFVFGYYFANETVVKELLRLLRQKKLFTWWLKVLMILLVLSVFVSLFFGGYDFLLPRLIRLYRFLAYLSIPFLVLAVVRSRDQYIKLFNLLFFLISLVGVIAFLQGLNVLPNFWPEYWRAMYSENDAPVATLSPHHKHIGVVMLVGVCLGMGYFFLVRSVALKLIIVVLILIMFTVPLFAGTRTYMLGFAGVLPALLIIGRINLVVPLSVFLIMGWLAIGLGGEQVVEKVERKYEKRVASRIERFGYEGLYRERTVIYFDIVRALNEHPYLLVTGTGYQNIFAFIRANGAHNNFLQALMELGLAGLIVFIGFLVTFWRNIRKLMQAKDKGISIRAQYTWVAFCGILMTMFVGETFWGQAAMFTLAGQLSFLFALAVSPYYWLHRYQNKLNFF